MPKQKTDGGVTNNLETSLEGFFVKKLPSLPPKAKEVIVKLTPWLVLIGVVFSLPTLLAALGLRGMMMSGWGYGYSYGYSLTWWISIASMVLMAIAIPGLFSRSMSAWRLLFYSSLVMALYYLVTFSLGSLIIGTGISMYLLFQVKSYYK